MRILLIEDDTKIASFIIRPFPPASVKNLPHPENHAIRGEQSVQNQWQSVGPEGFGLSTSHCTKAQPDRVQVPYHDGRNENGRAALVATGIDLPQSGHEQ